MEIKYIDMTKKECYEIWNNWRRRNKEVYDKLLKECYFCEKKQQLTIHHIDGDKRNNNIENLQCLCKKCHFKAHKLFQIRYFVDEKELFARKRRRLKKKYGSLWEEYL